MTRRRAAHSSFCAQVFVRLFFLLFLSEDLCGEGAANYLTQVEIFADGALVADAHNWLHSAPVANHIAVHRFGVTYINGFGKAFRSAEESNSG